MPRMRRMSVFHEVCRIDGVDGPSVYRRVAVKRGSWNKGSLSSSNWKKYRKPKVKFMKHNTKISKGFGSNWSIQTPDDNTKRCSKASGKAKSLTLFRGEVKARTCIRHMKPSAQYQWQYSLLLFWRSEYGWYPSMYLQMSGTAHGTRCGTM